MQQSAEINEIVEALVKAQVDIVAPPRSREVAVTTRSGPGYTFKYVPLDKIIEAIREPLTSNGLWFLQGVRKDQDRSYVETTLVHKSGQWIRSDQPLLFEGGTNQVLGASVTYAKRYGLSALLGIDSDDDDKAALQVRDIATGVGTHTAEPPKLELNDPYGEVEDIYHSPKDFLDALSEKVEVVGAYWPSNEHTVTWIGQFYNVDKDLVKHARQVFKFGKDAWKQSPDNPVNKSIPAAAE